MSVNASEQHLAALSRQTFLSMWSYQNPHYGRGKELCDVLVVFRNDVIIMSDKKVNYSSDVPPDVAWARWYKKAVNASVAQLRGALKTIQTRPASIYLDAKASSLFPLRIPESPRFHLIAIAHGSEEACRLERGTPSLAVDSRPRTKTDKLCVGTYFPEFVHVLNRTALDALFECFDTTVELVHYLREKEKLFSSNAGIWVCGEEDLIALYMRSRLPSGKASFTKNSIAETVDAPAASAGDWERLRASSDFLQRRTKLASSYLIDRLIDQIADDYRAGRMVVGQDLGLASHADAFSTLASETRIAR